MIRDKQEKIGIVIFPIILMAVLWLPLTFNAPQNQTSFALKQQVEIEQDSSQASFKHEDYKEISSNRIDAFSFLFKVIYKFAFNDIIVK